MKKSNITIPFDDEKLTALRRYAEKENAGVETELDDAVLKIYEKYVPKAVREYFELRDGENASALKKPGKAAAKKPDAAKAPASKADTEKDEPGDVSNMLERGEGSAYSSCEGKSVNG